MGQKHVSIDFGEKYIHILAGGVKNGVLEIKKAALVNTPLNSFSDGRLEDYNSIKKSIKAALAANRIKTKKAVFSTQSTTVVTRELIMPVMKDGELESAIKYEMEQYLPSTLDGYNIEFKIISFFTEDTVKKYKIRVAAMPSAMSSMYYKLALDLKLKPVALDIHSNSISRLFSKAFEVNRQSFKPDKTYAFIDMGSRTTTVNLITNGKLEFSRILSFGGREIDAAIAPVYDLTVEKAEQKKTELKISSYTPEGEDTREDAVKNALALQVAEIQKLFQFYTNRATGSSIQTIFIYGGASGIKGLAGFVKDLANINVIKIHEMANIKTRRGLELGLDHFLNAAVALIRY